jgi:hypothetical protein
MATRATVPAAKHAIDLSGFIVPSREELIALLKRGLKANWLTAVIFF